MRKSRKTALAVLGCLCLATGLAHAAATTSAFDNFVYSYTVTPEPGEDLRSFHVYTGIAECNASHYYNVVLPVGWMFDTIPVDGVCLLTFWTEGDALPAGQVSAFGFTHYCAPCCHSWFVSDEGSANPKPNVVDDDAQHTEPCNISAPWNELCGGPGLLLAPIYPEGVPNSISDWGTLKALYR